jgi:branched-chain amino acid transport system permease protein
LSTTARGTRRLALLLLVAALTLAAPLAAGAQESTTTTTAPASGTSIGGQLRVDGTRPVAGARITVADAAGKKVGEATTAADGSWRVAVPATGSFRVTLDPTSLPSGVHLINPDRATLTVPVQGGLTRFVIFGLTSGTGNGGGSGGTAGKPSAETSSANSSRLLDRLVRATVNGILFGLIIAMTAIGLSLIFGTTGLVNFAHGELVAFGAICAWFLNVSGLHIGPIDGPEFTLIVAALITAGLGAALGASSELFLWRPLRKRGTGIFQMMVISIGLSIAARQVLLIWFGSNSPKYREYSLQRAWDIGPASITPRNLVIIVVSVVILGGVGLMLQLTRIGKAVRAVSDNPDLAESSGINVQRVILFVWALAGGLAAIGGVLQGSATAVNYLLGFNLLLLMFAGVILGGLGTIYGAVVGSLVVGLATEISSVFISPELKTVAALAVLIIILMVRPQGILGRRERVA